MPTLLVIGEPPNEIHDALQARPDWLVLRAEDADEARRTLRAEDVDVLLAPADLVAGGTALAEELDGCDGRVPVVAVSPHAGHPSTVECLMLGAATFVPESRRGRDLVATLDRLLAITCSDASAERLADCLDRVELHFSLPPDRSLIPVVIHRVTAPLGQLGLCGKRDRLRAAVALEEALQNGMIHGNLQVDSKLREGDADEWDAAIKARAAQAPYADRVVTVRAVVTPDAATYVVTDEGPGYDPGIVPDPTDPEMLARPHGRGLLLMRTFMDEVSHNDRGNEVTLVKRRGGE